MPEMVAFVKKGQRSSCGTCAVFPPAEYHNYYGDDNMRTLNDQSGRDLFFFHAW